MRSDFQNVMILISKMMLKEGYKIFYIQRIVRVIFARNVNLPLNYLLGNISLANAT